MALIKCKECNKEISDKANSCPHCGVPVVSAHAKLKVQGLGLRSIGIKPVQIYFNNSQIGTVGRQEIADFEFPTGGQIDFKVKIQFKDRTASLTIKEGETISVVLDVGPLGGLLLKDANSGSGSIWGVVTEIPEF